MRKLWLVVLVGCWSSSPKPASPPQPVEGSASTGGNTYGGSAYGGGAYGGGYAVASLTGTGDVDGALLDASGLSGNSIGSISGGTGTGYGGIGHGPGTGTGGPARGPVPSVSIGDPAGQTAGLDKAIIRRFMKRSFQKIRYCYEKELLTTPSLAGKVVINFTIDANGNVSRATGAGMPGVEGCVASVILGIQFPKPQGGGTVNVSYPFHFQTASSAAPPSP